MTRATVRIGLVVEGDSERWLFEELRPWFRGRSHKYPTKTEMVRRLSRHFDLDRAASGNRSARRFVRKLAGVSSGS